MESTKNLPVYENGVNKYNNKPVVVDLPASKGIYRFFCKNTSGILQVVVALIVSFFAGMVENVKGFYSSLVQALWIVHHNSLKLEGIDSISSSVIDNLFCQCRRKIKECICKSCYADSQQRKQFGLQEHNIINGIILRNILIPVPFFKLLKFISHYIRIESFGDVMTVTQARNYIRIIKAFPRKRCAIWSKNIAIWSKAFALEGKPDNCTYIHSSSTVNKPDVLDLTIYWFVDHVFTVYDAKYIKKHNIRINCGGKKCMECIKRRVNCYFRTEGKNNDNFYINEKKK